MAKKSSKIFRQYPFVGPPKFTQYGSFGKKIYHLATLDCFNMMDGMKGSAVLLFHLTKGVLLAG
jgi:hypothetical protein